MRLLEIEVNLVEDLAWLLNVYAHRTWCGHPEQLKKTLKKMNLARWMDAP